MLDAGDVVEEVLDFQRSRDDGELFLQAGASKVVFIPGHLQRDQVQELDGGDEGIDGLRREVALLDQKELILADGFEVEFGGRAVEILGELGDIMDIASRVVVAKLRMRMSSIMRWRNGVMRRLLGRQDLVIWENNLIQCFREPRSTLGGEISDKYRNAVSLCAGHVQQFGGASPPANLMEVKA